MKQADDDEATAHTRTTKTDVQHKYTVRSRYCCATMDSLSRHEQHLVAWHT